VSGQFSLGTGARRRPRPTAKLAVALLSVLLVGLLIAPTSLTEVVRLAGPPRPLPSLDHLPLAAVGAVAVAEAEASLNSSDPATAFLQTPGWRAGTGAIHPSARYGASEAYDPSVGAVVLFGGTNGSSYFNDTWEYLVGPSGEGGWVDLNLSHAPQPRAFAAFAFDEATGDLVLFGGSDATHPYNSTWTFHGTSWSILNASGPSARFGSAMTYDEANGGLLLFGGQTGSAYDNDLYELQGASWVRWTPTGAPGPRSGAAFVFDPALAEDILAGGHNASGIVGNTWTLHANTWTFAGSLGTTPAVYDAAVALDQTDGVVLLAGGNTTAGPSNVTWELPTTGGWSLPHFTAQLSARTSPSAAFDPDLGATVLFGGQNGSALSDTWLYSLSTAPLRWREANTTYENQTSQNHTPPRRTQAGFTYDAADGYVVMFGGLPHVEESSGDLPKNYQGSGFTQLYNDTWIFRNNTWTNITPTHSPGPRRGLMMEYDPRDGYLVMFGGSNDVGYLNDTWKFRAGVWTELFPTVAPPPRRSAGFTYDSTDGELLLFGGHAGSVVTTQYTFFNDLWAFTGGNWTLLHPSNPPPPNAEPFFAYDPASGQVVLFGGYKAIYPNGTGEFTMWFTWTLYKNKWTNLTTQVAGNQPGPRDGGAFIFDPVTGGLVEFGGDDLIPPLPDVWSFKNDQWTEDCALCAPPGRAGDHGTWDPAIGGMITFGPPNAASNTTPAQTWINVSSMAPQLTVTPPQVDLGYGSNFSAQIAGGVQPLNASWNFNDGTPNVTGWSAYHVYSSVGVHTVSLVVHDGLNLTQVTNYTEYVNATPVVGSIRATPWGPGFSTARVSASLAALTGTPPFRFVYSFGDGQTKPLYGVKANHTSFDHLYMSTGMFSPGVVITDAFGHSASGSATPITLPATPPTVQILSNRSTTSVPQSISLTLKVADLYGPESFAWNVSGTGASLLTNDTNASNTLRLTATGVARVTVTLFDSGNFTATAELNVTGISSLVPTINVTVGNDLTCPVQAGSATVGLNASATGGMAPYTFVWTVGGTTYPQPDIVAHLTPGQSLTVSLRVNDSAGDNATLSRSVLVPAATCGPQIGLNLGILAAAGIGVVLGAIILIEAVVLCRRRRAPKAPLKPVDPSDDPSPAGTPPRP
jgi:hypothetical protein